MGDLAGKVNSEERRAFLLSRGSLDTSFPSLTEGADAVGQADLPAERSLPLPPGRVVVVVNDGQRPTPTPWLLSRLKVDWEREGLAVAVATGSHAPPREEELGRIFGPLLEKVRPRLVLHRPAEEGSIPVGETRRGTPVRINPLLDGADAVVCLGSVEPHYFAAWTGGRKSLVPGLCSLETMRVNHRLAVRGGAPGMPEVSPVHHDLDDALRLVETWLRRKKRCEILGLNVVTRRERIYDWFYGPLGEAVARLAPAGRRVFGRSVEGTYPLVVCLVDPPLDRDLYQALKAFENWKRVVEPGGVLILEAGCAEGLGPPPFRQFLGSPPGLDSLMGGADEKYRLGDHKLINLLRFLESGRTLLVVSGGPLPRDELAVPVHAALADALDSAELMLHRRLLRTLCVEDAAHLYPLPPLRQESGETP